MFSHIFRASMFIVVVVMILFSLSVKCFSETPQLIPREALFGNPEKSQAKISPDGIYLSYLAPVNGVMNVFVQKIGVNKSIQITNEQSRAIRDYSWFVDSKQILYLQDNNGDENFHIYLTDIKKKRTRDLTPFIGVKAGLLDMNAKYPNQILATMNYKDKHHMDVYKICVDNGAVELDTENPGTAIEWLADNNMTVRGRIISLTEGGYVLQARKTKRDKWKTIISWGINDITGRLVGFSPDNRWIYAIISVGSNTSRLVAVDTLTKSIKIKAEDYQYDVNKVFLHPGKRTVLAVQIIRERSSWDFVDNSVSDDFIVLKGLYDGDFNISAATLANDKWVVEYMKDDASPKYCYFDRLSKKVVFLFSTRPALDSYKLSRMEPFFFLARDEMRIYGYLTLPCGYEPKNLPLVVLVHNGPWERDVWGFNSEVQWLANRGYAVVQINYRGSTGYGKDYLNAGNKEWGSKMIEDLINGKNWVLQKGFCIRKNVGIFGRGYGGNAVLSALAFTPSEFACGVDINGPSNLLTMLRSLPPYWGTMRPAFQDRVGSYKVEEDFLWIRSPLSKVNLIRSPLLVAQGANDPWVRQQESDQIVQAIRDSRKDVLYLLFSDEGQSYIIPENRLKFYALAESFLAKYLGGRADSAKEKENVNGIIK